MASHGKKTGRKPSATNHRSTLSVQKTEVLINVYDLLPPGRLSSTFWVLGCSLLHSGVVVKDREYAFGGHDKRGLTGVYWTRPKTEPPGGTFRCEILHGFTASEEFLGTSYNLLTLNCNHFTSHLCHALTSRRAPAWLNRAASIGLALPCVVPQEWIAPPDADTADGALLDDGDEYRDDERSMMLRSTKDRVENRHSLDEDSFMDEREDRHPSRGPRNGQQYVEDNVAAGASSRGKTILRDTSGRPVPTGEIAPTPRIR
ncbi:MAG: hypothetical protein M1813_002635 [Trichoglossum hirsutum]|nr:MAG: hypothetical protein M1813_002635 [Trichoglossum hirsutum]